MPLNSFSINAILGYPSTAPMDPPSPSGTIDLFTPSPSPSPQLPEERPIPVIDLSDDDDDIVCIQEVSKLVKNLK